MLEQVVAETREARNLHALTRALTVAGIATGVFLLTLWFLRKLRLRLRAYLVAALGRRVSGLKFGGTEIVEGSYLLLWIARVLITVRWLVIMLLAYNWLSLRAVAFSLHPSMG